MLAEIEAASEGREQDAVTYHQASQASMVKNSRNHSGATCRRSGCQKWLFGPISPKLGPISVDVGPMLASFRRLRQILADVDQICSNVGQVWPKLVKFGHVWTDADQGWAEVDQSQAGFGLRWPSSAKC